MSDTIGRGTLSVHAGKRLDTNVGGVTTPIHASSAYLCPGPTGYDVCYPRYANIPTQEAAAEKIAILEGGEQALVLASGMAAISASIAAFARAGDHVVVQADVYGGTHQLAAKRLPRLGIEVTLVSGHDAADFERALRPNTTVIYVETPANPLMSIVDLAQIAALGRRVGATTIVDNTFATPINQNPLALGVDVVVHSGTKYLNGHDDLCCGVLVSSKERVAAVREFSIDFGQPLGPLDCFLLERGLKTLALRVARQNENGMALAAYLSNHPRVTRVYHPGLPTHPGHAVAARQMRGFGGMLAFDLDATFEQAEAAVARLRYVTPAVSLGGVGSLCCFPARTSHEKMPRGERLALGISDTLIRISAGIEDAADLLADLEQALA